MAKYVIEIDTEHPYKNIYGDDVYSTNLGVFIKRRTMESLKPLTAEYINEHFWGIVGYNITERIE